MFRLLKHTKVTLRYAKNMPQITEMDLTFMRQALELEKRVYGMTSPNPAVGAVLVKKGHVIGEGFHSGPGNAHAEVEAINAASDSTTGCTLYVTLEPCAHQGRTPPCADALIAAGVLLAHVGDGGFGVRRLDLERSNERVLGFDRHLIRLVPDLDSDRIP